MVSIHLETQGNPGSNLCIIPLDLSLTEMSHVEMSNGLSRVQVARAVNQYGFITTRKQIRALPRGRK